MLDKPSTHNRTKRSSNRSKSGPGPDRFATRAFVERCTDDCETARNQKRCSDALNRTGDHQLANTARETTRCRSRRENRHTRQKHQPASISVAQYSANENQRGKECRNCNINDRPVNESHAGRQNGCAQDPWLGSFLARTVGNSRTDCSLITGCFHRAMDASECDAASLADENISRRVTRRCSAMFSGSRVV